MRPPFEVPPGFDPMEPWERIDRIRADFRSDSLMHGVPRYEPRYPDDIHEAIHMMGVAIDMLLERTEPTRTDPTLEAVCAVIGATPATVVQKAEAYMAEVRRARTGT